MQKKVHYRWASVTVQTSAPPPPPPPWPELTLEEECCGGVGLRTGFFGHAVAGRNQDVLLGGRDRWVWRGWIWFFGWSFHVHFGTHDGVLVFRSGALEQKRSVQRYLCRSTRWRFHLSFVYLLSQHLQKLLHFHRCDLEVADWIRMLLFRNNALNFEWTIVDVVSYYTFPQTIKLVFILPSENTVKMRVNITGTVPYTVTTVIRTVLLKTAIIYLEKPPGKLGFLHSYHYIISTASKTTNVLLPFCRTESLLSGSSDPIWLLNSHPLPPMKSLQICVRASKHIHTYNC